MGLHLDELGDDLPLFGQLLQILPLKVGDADGLGLALPVGLLQLPVPGQPVPGGLVDVQQIHIVQAQALQGLVHGVLVLKLGGPQLGGEEDLLPLCAAGLDAPAAGPLVDVGVGGVDEGIAHLQGLPDAVLRLCGGEHEDAEADHRAFQIVVQLNGFHR